MYFRGVMNLFLGGLTAGSWKDSERQKCLKASATLQKASVLSTKQTNKQKLMVEKHRKLPDLLSMQNSFLKITHFLDITSPCTNP